MTNEIRSISNPRLSLQILTPAEVERLHTASLEVIEAVGVRFPSSRALAIWEAHGATVDHETMVVKAPGSVVTALVPERKREPQKGRAASCAARPCHLSGVPSMRRWSP